MMSMYNLYEMTSDQIGLMDLLADFGDSDDIHETEIREAIEEQLSSLNDSIRDKVKAIDSIVTEFLGLAQMRESESLRLKNLAKTDRKKAQRLQDYLMYCMKENGLKTINTDTCQLTLSKNGGMLPIRIDETMLSPQYYKSQLTLIVDSEKVRNELDAGKEVPGAKFCERGEHLRRK